MTTRFESRISLAPVQGFLPRLELLSLTQNFPVVLRYTLLAQYAKYMKGLSAVIVGQNVPKKNPKQLKQHKKAKR